MASQVLYLQEPLTICGGEEIRGQISCSRNAKNPRDLDIEIQVQFDGKCMAGHSATQQYRLR
jgi:protein arginine N-methyltransferase 1